MDDADRRRSPRQLLGAPARLYVGPSCLAGTVRDVSLHGMGLLIPQDSQVSIGELVWVIADTVAPYAITGTVVRSELEGQLGIEFEEVLHGDDFSSMRPVNLAEESGSLEREATDQGGEGTRG